MEMMHANLSPSALPDSLEIVESWGMNQRSEHVVRQGDARTLDWIPSESVHLVVTSPPYWTLKEYPPNPSQLGAVSEYDQFHDELEKV
jgi:DNA modification methylase